jgi:VanZ family protein
MRSGLLKELRVAAWACVVLLAVLSWVPADEMVRTGVDGRIEHVVAYMGTMLFVGAAYALRLGLLRLMAMLIGYAGILELGQNFSPGRLSSVLDFAASSFGVIVGAIVFRFVYALLRDTPFGRELRRVNQPSR